MLDTPPLRGMRRHPLPRQCRLHQMPRGAIGRSAVLRRRHCRVLANGSRRSDDGSRHRRIGRGTVALHVTHAIPTHGCARTAASVVSTARSGYALSGVLPVRRRPRRSAIGRQLRPSEALICCESSYCAVDTTHAAICALEVNPNFVSTFSTCPCAVRGEMTRCSAIARLVRP